MMRVSTWCAVAVIAMLGLTACKSRPRQNYQTGAQSIVAPAPSPMIAEPSYPPPAPSYPPAMSAPSAPMLSQADVDAARDQAALERQRREELERQLRLEQDRLVSAEGRIQSMEEKIADLEVVPPAGTGAAPDMAVAPSDSATRLADELRSRSAADVIRDGDMIIVRVTNGFRSGSDLLKQDVQLIQTLNATADALSRFPGATVAVVGHSDTDPIQKTKDKWANNDELSMARAQRVAQVLADNGVDRNRISIDGRGTRELLISPERTRDDKARNRRVEIMIRP